MRHIMKSDISIIRELTIYIHTIEYMSKRPHYFFRIKIILPKRPHFFIAKTTVWG